MSVSLGIQERQDSQPTSRYDVVVLGAGPYGLSATAHLQAQGLKVAIFGKPIHYWRANMPEGMRLRSYWWASNLSDPEKKYSFEQYYKAKGLEPSDNVPIEVFIDYGLWFQEHAVPEIDETYITNIERKDGQFVVTLEDGRVVQSKAVVMAPGLHYYLHIPDEFAQMPSTLVTHSAEHHTLDQFMEKKVAVVGRGQAALETAALLYEKGAKEVHLIARHPLRWVPLANQKVPVLLQNLRAPQAGMGSGWLNLLLEKYPYLLQRLPMSTRDYVLETRHGPAGSPWLKSRLLGKVALHENEPVKKVEEIDGRVQLTLTSGKELLVDHVILGTGYRTDVKRLEMLEPSLRYAIKTYKGSPVLNNQFESSVPGLYFIGFSAARCFGPFYRFVVGAGAAAKRVADAISRQVVRSR